MSGFIAIVNVDGAPVDRPLLWRLTQSIAYRGPDAQEIQILKNIGFGHTMLRSTFTAQREHQPCTVDNESWITADCRIDAREELINELCGRGRPQAKDATDPELILHAWAVWGTDCVRYLLGDFAFVIWDEPRKRLFCARDHMGIKPLYYAQTGNCLVLGNTLNTIRAHPSISSQLNDLAIADFLLFGLNQDLTATSFEDIHRLPPAHKLVWTGVKLQINRYWTIPIDPPLRFRRRSDYTAHFLDLFRMAVRDRLRTGRAGILMSGGLDSTGMAAIAGELAGTPPSLQLSAHTLVADRLIPDCERYYAGIAGAHLGIPVHFQAIDGYRLFQASREGVACSPDPAFIRTFGPAERCAELGAISGSGARVALYGEGPDDALFYEWKPYVKHELASGHFFNLGGEIASFPFLFRHIPFWTRLRGSPRKPPPDFAGEHSFPSWLTPGLVKRFSLRERFERIRETRVHGDSQNEHPVRPFAFASFAAPMWQAVFEAYDPGVTAVQVEVRYPYVDIRMLRFLLAVPVLPWCRNKYLIRRSLRPYLPEEIVRRPKTGAAGSTALAKWKEEGFPRHVSLDLALTRLTDYVDAVEYRKAAGDLTNSFSLDLRLLTLDLFLRSISGHCIL